MAGDARLFNYSMSTVRPIRQVRSAPYGLTNSI